MEVIFTSLNLTNRPLLEESPALQTYPGARALCYKGQLLMARCPAATF
jgi:hypothetical protein